MKRTFTIKSKQKGVILNRFNVCNLTLDYKIGQCKAVSSEQTNRSHQWYIKHVLNPSIKNGTISDGTLKKYDDRKLRFDYALVNRKKLTIYFGLTTYQEIISDIHRDLKKNMLLKNKGAKAFGDEFAFFSRASGITVLPISIEGSVFVGQRINTSEYPNQLSAIAGYLDFNPTVSTIDIYSEALREANEEMGILAENIFSLDFLGIYGNSETGEVDFVFLAKTNLPNLYFCSKSWKKKRIDFEHKNLIQLSSIRQVKNLVNDSKEQLTFGTRAALMNLNSNDLIT